VGKSHCLTTFLSSSVLCFLLCYVGIFEQIKMNYYCLLVLLLLLLLLLLLKVAALMKIPFLTKFNLCCKLYLKANRCLNFTVIKLIIRKFSVSTHKLTERTVKNGVSRVVLLSVCVTSSSRQYYFLLQIFLML